MGYTSQYSKSSKAGKTLEEDLYDVKLIVEVEWEDVHHPQDQSERKDMF